MNYKLRPDQNGSRPPTFINMDEKINTITEYRQTLDFDSIASKYLTRTDFHQYRGNEVSSCFLN